MSSTPLMLNAGDAACDVIVEKAILAERERVREIVKKWTRADHIQLHAGEMTAGELRSVKAVVNAIIRETGESQ